MAVERVTPSSIHDAVVILSTVRSERSASSIIAHANILSSEVVLLKSGLSLAVSVRLLAHEKASAIEVRFEVHRCSMVRSFSTSHDASNSMLENPVSSPERS